MSDTFDRDAVYLLGRMDGKLDALIAQTGEMALAIKDHDTRLDAIERWRAWMLGAGAAAGAAASAGVQKLSALFS